MKKVTDHHLEDNHHGPADLIRDVFDKDRCAVCGACVGWCPYFIYDRGRVIPRTDAPWIRAAVTISAPWPGPGAPLKGKSARTAGS